MWLKARNSGLPQRVRPKPLTLKSLTEFDESYHFTNCLPTDPSTPLLPREAGKLINGWILKSNERLGEATFPSSWLFLFHSILIHWLTCRTRTINSTTAAVTTLRQEQILTLFSANCCKKFARRFTWAVPWRIEIPTAGRRRQIAKHKLSSLERCSQRTRILDGNSCSGELKLITGMPFWSTQRC